MSIFSSWSVDDEYHAFQYFAFLNLQISCDINVISHPQVLQLMAESKVTLYYFIDYK